MRILIIEDEKKILAPLQKGLENRGYAVDTAVDGEKGYELAAVNSYDVILLDLNLPKMGGIELAKRLREEENTTPILMLTARSTQQEILEGFESGTDDYLTKPFDFKELCYRIEALIKRNNRNNAETLEAYEISLDPKARKITLDDKPVQLNNKEFGILEYLMRNIGKVVSQEELLEHVWDREVDIFTQTVRTNIKTLRKKVDPDKQIIKTIRGAGYVIPE
jgi:DNA-binding response OmpR family regulator